MLKDEMGGKSIYKFVGLKPQIVALMSEDGGKKRTKGVTRAVLNKRITSQNYIDCLNLGLINRQHQINITSDHHDIITLNRYKIALSSLDYRIYWIDNVNSLAFNRFRTRSN